MNVLRIVLAALLLQSAVPQFVREKPGAIEGIVVKAGTNEPIGGATVELTGIAGRTVERSSTVSPGVISVSVLESAADGRVLSFAATTRADGRFVIQNIPPAAGYQLVAMRLPDYLPAQYGQRVPAVPGRSITILADQQLKDIRIEVTPGGKISGRVVDSNGQGLGNIIVELRRPWYLEGWRLLADWREMIPRVQGVGKTNRAASTRTNGRGEFSFPSLAPAQYYIRTTFTNEGTAEPINLHAGASINDVTIVIPQLRSRQVRGQIIDKNTGRAVPSAQIAVIRRDAVPLYAARIDSSQSRDGVFEVTVPGPGSYFLLAEVNAGSGRLYGRKAIDIADSDLKDIRIEVARGANVSGTVTVEGKPRDATLDPMFLSLNPTSAGWGIGAAELPIANGSFTARSLTPGEYRVEVPPILTVPPTALVPSSLQNAYVKAIRMGSTDVLSGGLHLESGPDAALQIVIAMNGGMLDGRVVDGNGMPVANVKAVVVPASPRRQRGDLYKSVSTDDAGRFQLRGLAPGDYQLFAWERVEEGAWQDPQYIKLFEGQGTPVHIEEAGRTTAETRLILAWN